jgi:hypothetical protein
VLQRGQASEGRLVGAGHRRARRCPGDGQRGAALARRFGVCRAGPDFTTTPRRNQTARDRARRFATLSLLPRIPPFPTRNLTRHHQTVRRSPSFDARRLHQFQPKDRLELSFAIATRTMRARA